MSGWSVVNITPRSRLRTSPLIEEEVVVPTVKDLSFESAYALGKSNLQALKQLRGGESTPSSKTPSSKGDTMSENKQVSPEIFATIEGRNISSAFTDAQVAQALGDYLYRLEKFDSKTALAKQHATSTRSLDRWYARYLELRAEQSSSPEPQYVPSPPQRVPLDKKTAQEHPTVFDEAQEALGTMGSVFASCLPTQEDPAQEDPAQEDPAPPEKVPASPAKIAGTVRTVDRIMLTDVEGEPSDMEIDIRQPSDILTKESAAKTVWDDLTDTQKKALAFAHKTRASYTGPRVPKGVLDRWGLVSAAYRPFVEELRNPYIDSATLKVRGESFETLTSLTDITGLSAEEVLMRALKSMAHAYGL